MVTTMKETPIALGHQPWLLWAVCSLNWALQTRAFPVTGKSWVWPGVSDEGKILLPLWLWLGQLMAGDRHEHGETLVSCASWH